MSNMNKKKKMEDRISLLPDVLLHHILSSLNTKQVVQTCVLSKRWKTLWTRIPTLNFDYESYPSLVQGELKERSFKYFIIRVLAQHRCANIQKLSYNSSMNKNEVFLVELCLCYAGGHKVKQLCINTDNIGIYDWKYCLSACSSSLTVLKMICKFDDNWGALTLPSLRILEIEIYYDEIDIEADYSGVGTDFSCCPNLVSLVLIDYFWKRTTICCPKLENFEVYAPFDSPLTLLKLDLFTPRLKSVKFSNVLPTIKYDSEFLCIDKVIIELEDDCFGGKSDSQRRKLTSNFSELLRVFGKASSFTLPLKATQVISSLPFHSKGSSFRNMRHLRLETDKTDDMLLAYLLERHLDLKSFAVNNEGYKKRTVWD